MAELGPEVWSSEGLKVLGSPVRTPECTKEAAQEQLVEGPGLHCAWQLVVQCAGPRCHHQPESNKATNAWNHCWRQQQDVARRLATLSMRMGGPPVSGHPRHCSTTPTRNRNAQSWLGQIGPSFGNTIGGSTRPNRPLLTEPVHAWCLHSSGLLSWNGCGSSGCDRCHMHMWWSFGQFGAPETHGHQHCLSCQW